MDCRKIGQFFLLWQCGNIACAFRILNYHHFHTNSLVVVIQFLSRQTSLAASSHHIYTDNDNDEAFFRLFLLHLFFTGFLLSFLHLLLHIFFTGFYLHPDGQSWTDLAGPGQIRTDTDGLE